MKKVIIHYSEIFLKGKNTKKFEEKLISNVKESAKQKNVELLELKKEERRLFGVFNSDEEKITNVLKSVFGIKYFSFVDELEHDIESILEYGKKQLEKWKELGVTEVSFKTKRADKKFPLNSVEINSKLGEISSELGLKVNYRKYVDTLFFEITDKNIYAYTKKYLAYAGLPVGTSGKTLVLLSGGIDSPVASWNMMKRGCEVDFFHLHSFRDNKDVLESKIKASIDILNNYQFKSKLYVIPYYLYSSYILDKNVPDKYELVLFKYFLFKLAEKLVKKYDYQALVTGDNLGQVASQTMENIICTSFDIDILFFRPLLTYNKEEIIDTAKEIGTFDISIGKYKEPCSFNYKHPSTKTNLDKFKEILTKVNIEEIVDISLDNLEIFNFN